MNNLIRVEDAKLYLAKNYIDGNKSLGQCLDEVPTVEAVPMSVMEDIKTEINYLSDSVCRGQLITVYSWNDMRKQVFEIIDKHTSGK